MLFQQSRGSSLEDRASPAEAQVSPLKVILKGTVEVWEAEEKAGDVQRQGPLPSAVSPLKAQEFFSCTCLETA